MIRRGSVLFAATKRFQEGHVAVTSGCISAALGQTGSAARTSA